MVKVKIPPLDRKWYRCPKCGTKLAISDNTTECRNLYIKCRTCKREVKIDIKALLTEPLEPVLSSK